MVIGHFCGHELLSFLFRPAHKNLSTLDPASTVAERHVSGSHSRRTCRRAGAKTKTSFTLVKEVFVLRLCAH